jgi:hypothetical protein
VPKRKTNLLLIGHDLTRLGIGYVYGAYGNVYGHVPSESLLPGKQKQYPMKILPDLSFSRANRRDKRPGI